jgi:hypothetical protein
LAAQALASAVTPVQLVASAAAKQCAVLAARARILKAAMAGLKLAEAKLAEVGIPEVAGPKMLAARLAAPTAAAKMLEARMPPTAAAVAECNLLAEVRRP